MVCCRVGRQKQEEIVDQGGTRNPQWRLVFVTGDIGEALPSCYDQEFPAFICIVGVFQVNKQLHCRHRPRGDMTDLGVEGQDLCPPTLCGGMAKRHAKNNSTWLRMTQAATEQGLRED